MKIAYSHYATPIGSITLGVTSNGLCALGFSEYWDRTCQDLTRRIGGVARSGDRATTSGRVGAISFVEEKLSPSLRQILDSYFAGDTTALDAFDVDLNGTPFQHRVWAALRKIPAGKTISYNDLAERAGCPRGARAVGTANAENPVCLVVPCHRVIRADGGIGGYGGRVERKEWLLRHEGLQVNNGKVRPASTISSPELARV